MMFCALKTFAQTELKFDQKIIDCEDRWIAIPAEKGYAYGFVYLDNSAGLTFFMNGTFSITDHNTFVPIDSEKTIIRVLVNTAKFALIPKEKFAELKIEGTPRWLAFYRTDDQNVDRLFRLGYVYNRCNETEKALEYLNAVRKIDPKYPDLFYEYETVYRKMQKFGKAEISYYRGLKAAPQRPNWDKSKNDIFMLTKAGEMKKAEDIYLFALRNCADEAIKADMAYNIAFQYYKLKNKTKFKRWQNEVNRWIIPFDLYTDKMKMMATKL